MHTFRSRLLVSLVSSVLSGAAIAGPSPAPPAATHFTLGTVQVYSLRDMFNVVPNDGKVFGTDVGPGQVSATLKAAGVETDHITLAVDALLVQTADRVVLLDTGLGPKVGGVLPQSLAKIGLQPDQVTDVLVTHGHGDHTGGLLTANGKPAFPKATIRMATAEWAWIQTQPGNKALVDALRSSVKTFTPGGMVLPGFRSIALEGHTPGHVGYEITSGSAKMIDVGDAVHSSIVSLAHPEWANGYDNDASEGRAVREAELPKLAASRELIFAPHFPFPGVGTIVKDGEGYAWKPSTEPTNVIGTP